MEEEALDYGIRFNRSIDSTKLSKLSVVCPPLF